MKLQGPLLVVRDMACSVAFYRQVLGLEIIQDFGANKTLTGGLCLQSADSWADLTGCQDIVYGANNGEPSNPKHLWDDCLDKGEKYEQLKDVLTK